MIASLLYGAAHVVQVFFNMVMLVVLASVVVSWLQVDPNNPYIRLINSLTEPMFRPLRRLTQSWQLPVDFSPMIVMFIVMLLQKSIPMYLMQLYYQLK